MAPSVHAISNKSCEITLDLIGTVLNLVQNYYTFPFFKITKVTQSKGKSYIALHGLTNHFECSKIELDIGSIIHLQRFNYVIIVCNLIFLHTDGNMSEKLAMRMYIQNNVTSMLHITPTDLQQFLQHNKTTE